MDNYERRRNRKSNRIRKQKAVIFVIVFTALLTIGFIGGEALFKRSNAKASVASSNQKNASIPASLGKATENKVGNAESRETKVPDNPTVTDNINTYKKNGEKIAYLTFDDGPSQEVTPQILSVLDSYNVKATFFVIGYMADNNKDILLREWEDGMAIGNHSYSHNYKALYSNQSAFIKDIDKCEAEIKSIIGSDYNTKLLRFPGGSFGTKLQPYRAEAVKYGYHYVDWNAINGDAEANNVTVDKLVKNLKETTNGKEHVVILMHDAPAKETTVQALPQIIEYLKEQGYTFKKLQ